MVYSYKEDEDRYKTDEKWKSELSFVINGQTYNGKTTFYDKIQPGDTVSVEVYKTNRGEYKLKSDSNPVTFALFVAALLFGGMIISGCIIGNKDKSKSKKQIGKR